MCDLCGPEPEDLVDYCSCPLWEPCSCGTEAPIAEGYADMQPWRIDRDAEMLRRRFACQGSAA